MSQLTDNLNTIASIKGDIRDAIQAKGVDMSGVAFSGFASKIGEIQTGGGQKPEDTLAETIRSNGTYNYTPQAGHVFSSVALNVSVAFPVQVYQSTYTTNGRHSFVGQYSAGMIDVDVHPSTSLSETYTANGTYAVSGEFSGGQVVVSVPQFTNTNVIYYTSRDNNVITPVYNSGETDVTEFGANIVSNIYTGGQGVITFDGPVTKVGGRWRGTYDDRLTSIDIPDSVTVLKDGVFSNCDYLKVLKIPPFVTKIGTKDTGGSICSNSDGLTAVEIPPSVTEIYVESFAFCIGLVYVKLSPNLTHIGDYVFHGCSALEYVEIPDGLTEIGAGMFKNCGLTSIYIPASVTDIHISAFEGCSYAAIISVDSNNQFYDSRNNCNAIIETSTNSLICGFALTTIPSSVTEIYDSAFRGITTLTSITIPSSVNDIGYYAFGDCTNLTEVIVNATTPPTLQGNGSTVFYNNASGRLIKVPAASLSAYQTAPGWSDYASSIVAQ